MAELGRLTAVFDADTRRFDAGARGVASKVNNLTSNLSDLRGGVGSATAALAGFATPAGIAAGAAVVFASAVGSATVGLFNLVKSAADVGGELFDLSQKTGITVETLSTLSTVAKTTGGDIGSISASLGIFQKNMLLAGDQTSRQGRLFKELSIDTLDNEKALRQAFTALSKMGEGAQQTALAMQLFGRGGKDVLAIIKETNGNLDEARKKYDAMGLTINTSTAIASDRFNDLLEETTLQLSAVTRSIGLELLPVASDALRSISRWLAENKDSWSSWGTTISNVIRGVSKVAESEIGSMIGWLARLSLEITGIPALARGLSELGKQAPVSEDFFGPGGAARGGRKALPGTPEWKLEQSRLAGLQRQVSVGGGGGRGGGGGGRNRAQDDARRIAELELQIVVAELKKSQDANKRSLDLRRQDFNTYAREYMDIENRRHEAVVKNLDREQAAAEKKKGAEKQIALLEIQNRRLAEQSTHEENRNRVLDERRSILDQIEEFLAQQERDISALTVQTDRWDEAYQRLVDTLKEEGVVIEDTFAKRAKANIQRAREVELLIKAREALADIFNRQPDIALPELTSEEIEADLARQLEREAGGPPSARPLEVLVELREAMRDLAADLTHTLDDAIYDGLTGGMKRGLQTLTLGILDIIRNVFLRELQKALEEALTGAVTGSGGGGGGGFLKGLFGSLLGAVFGGFGGGGGGKGWGDFKLPSILPRADGGDVRAGYPYWVGERRQRELFVPDTNGHIYNQNQMTRMGVGAVTNNYYTINLPSGKGAYSSPQSSRQLADKLLSAIQASQG